MPKQDPMLEVFIFETQQLLESLEEILLQSEKQKSLTEEHINEIFRIMHTIKGSSSMMSFDNLSKLAHALEDMLASIREGKTRTDAEAFEGVIELVLEGSDILKAEVDKISSGLQSVGDFTDLSNRVHAYLEYLLGADPLPQGSDDSSSVIISNDVTDDVADDEAESFNSTVPLYKVKLAFEPDCQMENLRAFGVVNSIRDYCEKIVTKPKDLDHERARDTIIKDGFVMYLQSNENPDTLKKTIGSALFLLSYSLIPISNDSEELPESMRVKHTNEEKLTTSDKPAVTTGASATGVNTANTGGAAPAEITAKQNFISVNVNKLDKLMNLMGEIVTTESMVTKNPEVANLHIDSFERSSQELRKLINELQDIVMSIRMLPVSNTFQKMHRIVRDMSKKVGKEVELVLIGEETEVDKNIIDTMSDPLMHLIRNAVDHGIESPDVRLKNNKPATGHVTLEARNAGGDVVVLITDDGAGLNRNSLIRKATEKGLINKPESEISDREAYQLIFMPGFSTNTEVTEYSGRGVGMDVVKRNIDKVGGSISLDSTPGVGMTVQIRIPLTLAIIDGMKLRVGKLVFIVPMLSIQESFKPNAGDVFRDPDGSELIMIRGECYPVLRLYGIFDIVPDYETLDDGILIMITTDTATFCLFVDELIGEQQAVIKPLPEYIQKHNKGMHGLGGCAVLGDGSISLIIDINSLVDR